MTPVGVLAVCTVGGAVSGAVGDAAAARLARAAVPPRAAERVVAMLGTAALFFLAALRLGAVPALAAYCVLFGGLVTVSITDLRVGRIPRLVVYPALVVVAVALVAASASGGQWRALLDAVVGGAAAFCVLAAVWWCYPRGIGFGDVRLAGLCGLGLGWLGFAPLYLGFLAAFVVGSVVGLVLMAARGTGRKTKFAFGPALAAGTVIGVLWGPWLGALWIHGG